VLLQRSQIGEKIQVTPVGLTKLARWSSTTRAGLTKIAAQIDNQVRLAGLAGLATQSRKYKVPIGLLTRKAGLQRIQLTQKARLQKIWLTQKARLQKIRITRKAGLHRIWLTRKARLRKIRLTRKTGLCKTQGAGNRNEKVLLQAKG
jgi:hypothetical protein